MKIGINVEKKKPKIIQQSNIKNNYILFTTVDKQVGGRVPGAAMNSEI